MINKQMKLVCDLKEILRSESFRSCFDEAICENEWFTHISINHAIEAIVDNMLDVEMLDKWLGSYVIPHGEGQRVGIVMAGNIPMVGFFDLFCTLITENRAVVKLSSKDSILMGHLVTELQRAKWEVEVCKIMPADIDKLITMGGQEAANYYDAQFNRIPTLIRSHRYSVAVLTGDETEAELTGLIEDMFCHWGLGCRNVNRLYLPVDYDLERLPKFITDFKPFLDNYRYQKARCVMRSEPFYDKQGYLLVQDNGNNIEPPISVIKYAYYKNSITLDETQIQCIVTKSAEYYPRKVAFSESQKPKLLDYPDAKDVIKFLING